MYLVDFSSHLLAAFEKAPHVGSVIYDSQEEKLARWIHMVEAVMDERKKLLQGGNYSQYVQTHTEKLPALLIVIDNLGAFREKTKYIYDDLLLRLAREGVGYGMFLVVSAAGFGMSEIPSRLADNIKTVFALEQADKFKYMEVLRVSRLGILPETDVRGRGLAEVDGRILEFQTALSLPAADDFERGQMIENVCRQMRESWNGVTAQQVPEIPEEPTLDIIDKDERYKWTIETKELLPMGYYMKDAGIYSVNLKYTYCYTILGKKRTGKTNALKMFLYAAWRKQGSVCVVEKETSELKRLAEACQAEYVTDASQLFHYLSGLLPEFAERNKKKQKLLESGADDDEIFARMSREKPIFILLADLGEFLHMVYKPGENVGNMSGFVENIIEKGRLHHIYFAGCLKTEDQNLLSAYKTYQLFTGYKTGICLGGNLVAQKIFHFQNLSFAQQSKTAKKGLGYVPEDEEESNGVEVMIPFVKRQL